MLTITIGEIAQVIDATIVGTNDLNLTINAVETDSRKDLKGKLFVALKGERFDGHDFVQKAHDLGCIAVLVEHQMTVPIPQLIVKDTTYALGLLGRLNREKSQAKVVCITGTCGKTSVKEMTASILRNCGSTIATVGNLNNAIGVPLTLLTINKDTNYAVVELGASHPKDIEYGVLLARPIVALINNIGGAHLQGFGDLDGVYRTKSEILDFVTTHNGVGIVNKDSEYFSKWQQEYLGLKTFSAKVQADVYAIDILPLGNGCFTFTLCCGADKAKVDLQVPGIHNVSNALAASSIARTLGIDIKNIVLGLEKVEPVKGRLFVEKYRDYTLIDDAYNASVTAVKASLDTLALLDGYRVFVFGDMGELGQSAEALHQEVGAYGVGKVAQFLTVGSLAKMSATAFGHGGKSFASKEELKTYLLELVHKHPNLCVAVKGAHFMRMDEIADYLRQVMHM